jgi:hypothetical protein
LGILSYFGLTWELFASDGETGASGPALTSIDPSLYVEYNSVTPQRKQECVGLIGLCIGQPVDLAFDALGAAEADGFPLHVTPNDYQVHTTCHRWNPPQITSIDVCDRNGSISLISITFSGEPPVSIAMPTDYVLRPSSISHAAAEISEQYRTEPFQSVFLFGEGEYVAGFDWYFPLSVEGDPEIRVSVHGRSVELPSASMPEPCDEAGVHFPYRQVVEASSEIMVETIEVSEVAEADIRAHACS